MDILTYPIIQKLSDERLRLYELASETMLSVEQRQRLNEINDRLPGLWDQYRRDLASQHGPAVRPSGAEKLQKAVVAGWDKEEGRRAA